MNARRLSTLEAVIVGSLVTAAVFLTLWFIQHRTHDAMMVIYPGTAFTLMLLLGSGTVLERGRKAVSAHPYLIVLAPLGLWGLYYLYASGMGTATAERAGVMALYLTVPFVILRSGSSKWTDPVAILWMWLPLELGLMRRVLIAGAGADLHYAFAQLLAIDAGIIAFAIWHGTPDIGYRYEWSASIAATGFLSFLIYSAIAIPLGFEIGFIHYTFQTSKLLTAPGLFAVIFFATAIPEEFLFRGLIQNWLERITSSRILGLVIASIVFGAAHLNNGPPVPNYKYFLMASIAGIFYGWAWQRTRSLIASGLVHALVDTLWSVYFR
jgi:membrane protease YdiL (CAAX protease family)